MSNAIGRIRTLGIAAQPTFGTPAGSATFVLPMVDAPSIEFVRNSVRNESSLGSGYQVNSLERTNRFANLPLNIKIDEDHLPLFFKQRFSFSSSQVTGETTVYEHILTYTNTTNTWYTLFLQDDNRTDYVMQDVLFDSLNVVAESDFLRLEGNGRGTAPVTGSVTNTVVQPKEFVGRMATFNYGDYSGAKSAYNILSATLNHTFNLNDEGDAFFLGEDDLGTNVLTQDEFKTEITGLEANRDNYDDFIANTKKKYDIDIVSTDRFVTGSVTNINPEIKFDYPVAFLEEWSEDPPTDQLIKETIGLLPVDEVGVSTAPLQITVYNGTASY